MARDVQERENLLRDATAFLHRLEVIITHDRSEVEGFSGTLFAGFRRQGALSIYFDQDPVYQFTRAGLLRRAYVNGLLYKGEQGQLVSWQRKRVNRQVIMQSCALSAEEQGRWLSEMQETLDRLRRTFQTGEYQLVGQVPKDEDIVSRLLGWLDVNREIQVAQKPDVH